MVSAGVVAWLASDTGNVPERRVSSGREVRLEATAGYDGVLVGDGGRAVVVRMCLGRRGKSDDGGVGGEV